ncbi:extracellular solute-binding protein [Paenibacillus doosanensis]|uniref:extracellular solute-binding protein n=1 Tax=Paenibacillus doosanensis TaxID=1229154 RepID=UPI00217F6847|nr:extracellular solute-binding protein [Paenibacillus doosanensis]MCS7460656.1 extracellular solute-binding protein [Paenibacillus doosanensis]
MQKRNSRKYFRARLDEMIVTLREDIISGKIPVGSFLPSENDLEIQFQLSNNSVRKGLEKLVEEGLIEKIARVGNRVIRPPSENRTTIRFGYVRSTGALAGMDKLLDAFHRRYPHIQVQPVELPSSSYSRTLKEYLEAEMLDAAMLNNNNFQDFIEGGRTELLEPLEPDEQLYPFAAAPFRRGGDTLVQPFIFSPVVLCYNKDHFREAQVPEPDSSWTWQDLFRYGRQLAVKGQRFGFYFYLPSRNRWPLFMLQSGDTFEPDNAGEYHLTANKAIGGLEICRELMEMTDVFPVLLSESDADAEALFLEGKVSVIMTTYFFLNQLKDAGISFDVSPLPGYANHHTLLIVNGLAVSSRSRNKEAAKLLVDFMTSYETQLTIRRQTLNITAHRHAMEWQGEEEAYRPSRFFMYREIIPTFRLITEMGLSNNQLKEMQREIMLFLSGLLDRETLCRRLEQLLPEAGRGKLVDSL